MIMPMKDNDFVCQGSAASKDNSRESIEFRLEEVLQLSSWSKELESRFCRTAVYGTVRTVV